MILINFKIYKETFGDKAVELASFQQYQHNNHFLNKRIFDELRNQGQIEFVTFHQNYSYEDNSMHQLYQL